MLFAPALLWVVWFSCFGAQASRNETDVFVMVTINGTVVDASHSVRRALFGQPSRSFIRSYSILICLISGNITLYPAYALSRHGQFLYHAELKDTGDTACQGAVNVDQLGLLGGPVVRRLLRKWLLVTVQDHSSGQVWSQPGGQYHGSRQGALEANAEFILMARTLRSFDNSLNFNLNPERMLCVTSVGSEVPRYVGAGNWTDGVCTQAPTMLTQKHDSVFEDQAVPAKGSKSSDSYQGKRLVMRVQLPKPVIALHLPIISQEDGIPFRVCVRSVTDDRIIQSKVFNYTPSEPRWTSFNLSEELQPGAYDIAVSSAGDRGSPAAWLVDASPLRNGGLRVEVFAPSEPATCCGKHAFNSSLSAKLDLAMQWQLAQCQLRNSSTLGMFIAEADWLSGQPVRGQGKSSSSAMWDQVRMVRWFVEHSAGADANGRDGRQLTLLYEPFSRCTPGKIWPTPGLWTQG